jgi:hypothetical protein
LRRSTHPRGRRFECSRDSEIDSIAGVIFVLARSTIDSGYAGIRERSTVTAQEMHRAGCAFVRLSD